MQVASDANMAANTQKSSMKTTAKGARPSSSRRKVVISDDPKRAQGNPNSTIRSMDSTQRKTKDSPSKAGTGTLEGAGTTNLASTNNNTKNLLKRQSKPAYLQSLNESEKQANFKIIDSMNKKISYLKNPRHKVNKAPILMTTVSLKFSPLCNCS